MVAPVRFCLPLPTHGHGPTLAQRGFQMHVLFTPTLLLTAALAALASPAQAQRAAYAPTGAFVSVGTGENRLKSATVGAVWACNCWQGLLDGRVDAYVEASLGVWTVRGPNGRTSYGSLALVPMFRYKFDQGRSPWFVEAGIGAVATNRLYETKDKAFGSRLNFSDQLGVGYRLDPKQEVSLRVQHVSNAGIKAPNPGENLFQVRYAFTY